jgi:hypothetical protein
MKIIPKDFINSLRAAIGRLEEGEQLSGEELASLISIITTLEIAAGGPYAFKAGQDSEKTELTAMAPGVADIGLNLLIAYFLVLSAVDLPELNEFLEERLDQATSDFLSARELNDFAARWRNRQEVETKPPVIQKQSYPEEQLIIDKILMTAEKRFSGLSGDFRNFAWQGIKKTIEGNSDRQMSLMAYYTKQALGKKAAAISDEAVAEMGLANIFFWTAFIIYDDFWDEDEAADPRILPAANLYARHYVDFFSALFPAITGFREFFHKLMDNLDGANTWETIYCRAEISGSKLIIPNRFPDYGDYEFKFRPASGHILGSVAIMVQAGYGLESPEVKNFIAYFRHYLIAMQINDDSHDWEEDLRRGHISTVVAELLKDYQEKYPDKKEIDLQDDLLELKKIFWFKTIVKMARLTVGHTEESRRMLQTVAAFENIAPLERFINITESVAKLALDEQKKSLDFLNMYNKQSNFG